MRTICILPLRINGEVVAHKEDLKGFPLDKKKNTLYTVYAKMVREHDGRTFQDYLQAYCDHYGIVNPYVTESMNTKSRDWRELVDEVMTDENKEAVINNVISIAMGDSKNNMKAAELLANWCGASQKIDINADVKGDVDVSVKPDLFKLPTDAE